MIPSILHESCSNGDLDKVKEHLNKENIDEIITIFKEVEYDHWTLIQCEKLTPLICAIGSNHLPVVKYLHEHGVNIYLLE